MLRSDVIELLNSGRTWAFLGAGASMDSGGHTWSELLECSLDLLGEDAVAIRSDSAFKSALTRKDLRRAFGVVEQRVGRDRLEDAVRRTLPAQPRHGSLFSRLAEWPFEAYITLNYDGLLEAALAEQRQFGWSTVGNSESELRQVSSDARDVVWHVHGAASQAVDRSKLVLTDLDYDAVYLGDTLVKRQLRAVLGMRRLVLFGFGFADDELLRVIREVGQLADPTRPIIAFIPESLVGAQGGADELLTRYNVDALTYPVSADGSHGALKQLVHMYGSFVLKRTMRYRTKARAAPSYDPETTGLLVYNELVLRGDVSVEKDAFDALLRARVLSLLESRGRTTRQDISEDLEERARLIHRDNGTSEATAPRVEKMIGSLIDSGFVSEDGSALELTTAGRNAVGVHAGTSERLARQFVASLEQRASALTNGDAAPSVAIGAEAFLKDCIRRRSLGIAMVMAASAEEQDYQLVALLQRLPQFLEEMDSQPSAAALSSVVREVLADPSEAERTYIGLALQAQFGIHLLGLDPDALHARLREMSSSTFLVDANVLIASLARGNTGYVPAQRLVDGLRKVESTVGTTPLLITEVEEHAR